MDGKSDRSDSPITIKKYANRRLYNTSTSSYVTLDHLCQMVKDRIDFIVYDAKSGDDITRSVLTQIIVEEEGKGEQNLLPISFLRQLISYYGDASHQMLLPKYLDMTMQSFAENQEKMQSYMQETFGTIFPFGKFEEINKQNSALFEQAMSFFTPFTSPQNFSKTATREAKPATGKSQEKELKTLKEQLDLMQERLNKIEKDS